MAYNSVDDVIDGWGLARMRYNYSIPRYNHDTASFTQMVWKGTTQVGCSRKLCGKSCPVQYVPADTPSIVNGMNDMDMKSPVWLVDCRYKPKGLIDGLFSENVANQTSGNPSQGIANVANVTMMVGPMINGSGHNEVSSRLKLACSLSILITLLLCECVGYVV